MDEMEMSMTINIDFKIIPFDDALWRAVFPQLKKQLGIEQINIVESRLFCSAFKHYYDVYVDKALIKEHGCEKVNEMVKEKIKERIDKEMERDLGFLTKHIKEVNDEIKIKNKNDVAAFLVSTCVRGYRG